MNIKNMIYSGIASLGRILFPVLTFGYASRILGAEGIGKVAFVNSIVTYFILFASLGIPIYGMREVAKARKQKSDLSKVVIELFLISCISTAVCLFVYLIFITQALKDKDELQLYLVGSILILTAPLNFEWFYKGVQEFKAIAIRMMIVNITSLIMVFLLIRSEQDFTLYYAISVFSITGSYIWLLFMMLPKIDFSWGYFNLKRHLKPVFWLFSTTIAISIYTQMDVVMLGILASDEAVGLYTASIKVNKIVVVLITSATIVYAPQITQYIQENNSTEASKLFNTALGFIIAISAPFIIGIYFSAESILKIIVGEAFLGAALSMKILSLLIPTIALSNIAVNLGLVPLGLEKKLTFAVVLGALVNFTLNLLLIPKFQVEGAASSTIFAEMIVTITSLFFIGSRLNKQITFKDIAIYFSASLTMIAAVFITKYMNIHFIGELVIIWAVGLGLYLFICILFKDSFINKYFHLLLLKVRTYRKG